MNLQARLKKLEDRLAVGGLPEYETPIGLHVDGTFYDWQALQARASAGDFADLDGRKQEAIRLYLEELPGYLPTGNWLHRGDPVDGVTLARSEGNTPFYEIQYCRHWRNTESA